MVWKRSTSPAPKKASTTKSADKFMFIFSVDMDGMLLQHAVPRDRQNSERSVLSDGVYIFAVLWDSLYVVS